MHHSDACANRKHTLRSGSQTDARFAEQVAALIAGRPLDPPAPKAAQPAKPAPAKPSPGEVKP